MISVHLALHADFNAWRPLARQLLQAHIAPENITWCSEPQTDIFENSQPLPNQIICQPKISAAFIELATRVCCHRDPHRYALLYRLAWRLQQNAHLLDLAMDDDVLTATQMAKQAGREVHKMKAFIRFRETIYRDEHNAEQSIFIAWFEPQHYTLTLGTPFFIKRFCNMHWAILTPYQSVYWDQQQLYVGMGAQQQQAPSDDDMEKFWLTYYASTFNPARLKVKAMLKEMPRYYWNNLPEARLIPELIARAGERQQQMIAAEPTAPKQNTKTKFDREKWLQTSLQPRLGKCLT
jgi:DNA polymerase